MADFLTEMDALNLPTVLIHGNHEDEEEVAQIVEGCNNLHFVHGQVKEVKGIKFFGFGGHGFRQREPLLEQLAEQQGHLIDGTTIILSHTPPYGTAVDEIEPGWHVGNQSLLEIIEARLPMLVLCGHIHECFHERDEILGVPVINPGPDGEIIEVEGD
ncbi:hypothetical protein GOV11_01215 [Candidatus Woesearchaeota archaeon]|nr:hypothetical protein [Candidatus Woesearchaeota archaeon]